jgi:8-oxo-dGTP pyrophosphatase MutT (NUDIX family)
VRDRQFVDTLRLDLARYRPEGDREALGSIDALLDEQGTAALERSTFLPGHLTASGFVLSPDRTKTLLIFHRKLQLWLQPGGHIEPEDAGPEAACRREIGEETGVVDLALLGLFDLDVHDIPERPGEPAHAHFDVRYAFVAGSEDAYAGDGADDFSWVKLEATGFDDSVSRPLHKLQQMS